MTKTDVIDYIDGVKPNVYTEEQKKLWIDLLENKLRTEVLDNYEDAKKKEKVTTLDNVDLYSPVEDDLVLTGPVPTNIKEIVEIPAKVSDMDVVTVQSDAFTGCNGITGIIIPSSVTEITGTDFPAGITVYGTSGSAAETYADEHGIPFVIIGTLLASGPYEDMYYRWVEAQIDYANNEIQRYNNALALFNDGYDKFKAWYSRTHTHKTTSLSLL